MKCSQTSIITWVKGLIQNECEYQRCIGDMRYNFITTQQFNSFIDIKKNFYVEN